ncbi:MAG: major capsid protein [Arizlama microvirus]|nr:MAG: major capsid protein [Arizlama microvirus]
MKRSKFSLSNYKLMSCNMGELIPCGLTEVLPGDTLQQATSALIRTTPLLAPVMHPVHARIHHWFVPHRLCWENWEDFITGGPDGLDASVFPTKTILAANYGTGSLADYMGVPTPVATETITVSAIPFRGYSLIYNEWYRDQDLSSERAVSLADGADSTTEMSLAKCSWEKDYFTTCRPWAQKGPDVTVPVQRLSNSGAWLGIEAGTDNAGANGALALAGGGGQVGNGVTGISLDPQGSLASTIPELRTAFALYRYQEARARYGSRYTEYLRYLGVKSSDARLQRPEYLGGGKQTIQFSEVLQTGVTTDGDDQEGVGNLKGHGIGAMRSNRYRRFFEEHGYVFTFLSVKPRTIYQQGLPRHFNRRTKEDFFQKELQFIGQQEVLQKELYAASSTPDATFGYQDRYDEYRRGWSSISGEFRNTLNYWHMGREFSTDPALNNTFIEANPTTRIYSTGTTIDPLFVMVNNSIQARRIVAAGSTPGVF